MDVRGLSRALSIKASLAIWRRSGDAPVPARAWSRWTRKELERLVEAATRWIGNAMGALQEAVEAI